MSLREAIKEIIDYVMDDKKYFQKPKERATMLDGLKGLFKKENSLIQTCKVSAIVINLLNEFNQETLIDIDAKDLAIDCVIELLEDEKKKRIV